MILGTAQINVWYFLQNDERNTEKPCLMFGYVNIRKYCTTGNIYLFYNFISQVSRKTLCTFSGRQYFVISYLTSLCGTKSYALAKFS